jgi:hypothetical protein
MPSAGYETAIPAMEPTHTCALDHTTIGMGSTKMKSTELEFACS